MAWLEIDETHAPERRSWHAEANEHPEFPIQNLPLGIFSRPGEKPRPGVAIGNHIIDLFAIRSLLPRDSDWWLDGGQLNALLGLPPAARRDLRRRLSELLSDNSYRSRVEPGLIAERDCTLHLPASIGDYSDFYVGIHHATNVGKLFRPDNPLLPNYKHVPIGYHGRASSIRPSGVPLVRPSGQAKGPDDAAPKFGPTARLDYELELGIWIGEGNELGEPIPIGQAPRHVAGYCLLNDWSARDFQAWEYVPLGPFLAKNFHTSISPWVITPEALAPFRTAQAVRDPDDPAPLPYLWDEGDQSHGALAIRLKVSLTSTHMRAARMEPAVLSQGSAVDMYWTAAQIVAHHASNGCNLNPGDLLGTGTISGAERSTWGSLLEITRGGAEPVELPSGEQRRFLEDGDEIVLTGRAEAPGYVPIGFGECRARIMPAKPILPISNKE
ncbi:MAG: fumarylacetoacetase [Sphingopyxis sp.]|nr:fumarylacetoacetase [Sphingopyxis sp.]